MAKEPTHLCRKCGNRVRPIIKNKVNGCFLIVLLFLLIIPGILYWVWATTQKISICPVCKGEDTCIPLDAPEAERTLSEVRQERPCPFCAEPILAAAKVCKHCGRDVA